MPFQTFDPLSTPPEIVSARVAALRENFAALGVDGVLVPHEDAYQSEYLPASEERLAFITGFTGSAGRAIILMDQALFATDGRYTLQAQAQVPDLFTIVSDTEAAKAWAAQHLSDVTLGFDPNLHSRAALDALKTSAPGLALKPLDQNPVDAVWPDQPKPPAGKVRLHPMEFAGQSASDKIDAVRESMSGDALLIATSDTVSWLLNWRGEDVAHTPLVLSRAFVPREGPVTVFVDPAKVPQDVQAALGNAATIADEASYTAALGELSAGITVSADPAKASAAALSAIESSGTLHAAPDPAALLQSIKNDAEVRGMRAALQRDGVAMVRFLAWFDEHAVGKTEIDLVEQLEACRREVGIIDVSFPTIAGAAENGAIVHYRVDRTTNRTIAQDDPVLVDSGGQYVDGTTDITRTLVAGTPSDEFRAAFTKVLKGHIAIALQHFPEGTTGADLDTLARAALWNSGHDYAHGTGHGVGAALGVHEGPPGISKRSRTALKPGMILSNEPGLYPGSYGIRIENLILVQPAQTPLSGNKPMLFFETLTLAPIDTRLVAPHLMTAAEIAWLDAYHARVHGALVADLAPSERAWLEERCRPIVG